LKETEVRWLVIAAIAVSSSFAVHASEPQAETAVLAGDIDAPYGETSVIITPVPMPASVIEVLQPINRGAKLRSAKKPILAKQKHFPTILLSRTERHQLALLSAKPKTGDQPLHKYVDDENDDDDYSELVLHRSYSRPRLTTEEHEDDADEPHGLPISENARLRLFLARMKAVEAHALAQAGDSDEPLSDTVLQRLQAARQKAVEAHQKKFG
jgi:hypothetical protein